MTGRPIKHWDVASNIPSRSLGMLQQQLLWQLVAIKRSARSDVAKREGENYPLS